jgi:hypothetical protein
VKIVNAIRIVAALLAALCWFMSARTKLTRVTPRKSAGLAQQQCTARNKNGRQPFGGRWKSMLHWLLMLACSNAFI